jgi:hypothetical protein
MDGAMTWILGVDEAGYGPNLGPLTMAAVVCEAPEDLAGADLWDALAPAVRKSGGDDDRLIIDDSKAVYAGASSVAPLERGVLATLWRRWRDATTLGDFVAPTCTDSLDDLRAETWYTGTTTIPSAVTADDLKREANRFDEASRNAQVRRWSVRGVALPAARFNSICDDTDSKGAVLAHALGRLLARFHDALPDAEPLCIFVDKHGGRNSYAAMIQDALPGGMVVAEEEGPLRSVYRVVGLSRPIRLTIQPRADAEHFSVALASMTAKYLRELFMLEFNRFWIDKVPGLKPTAGYPGDAARYMDAIRPAAEKLGIAETAIWRKR